MEWRDLQFLNKMQEIAFHFCLRTALTKEAKLLLNHILDYKINHCDFDFIIYPYPYSCHQSKQER